MCNDCNHIVTIQVRTCPLSVTVFALRSTFLMCGQDGYWHHKLAASSEFMSNKDKGASDKKRTNVDGGHQL